MFKGSIVAIVTPMRADGAVDYASLERLIEHHIAEGTDGIVSVGTTGESATLSFEDHQKVIRRTIEMVDKRIPVIAGTGANATDEAIFLTEKAKELGADAGLSVVPYYNKPTQKGLIAHFSAIAKAVDLPLMLYNVPGRTVVDMLPETTAELAKLDNVVGVKEAEGSLERTKVLLDLCDDDFVVLSGEDPTACESMVAGAHGVISVTANIAPKLMHEMCAAALAGDMQKARDINQRLDPLHSALFCESNPTPSKWALMHMGLMDSDCIRLPLLPLSEDKHDRVRAALAHAGLVS